MVKGDQKMAMSCYTTTAKETLQVTVLDSRMDSKKGCQEPAETLEEMKVNQDDPNRIVKIRSSLSEAIKDEVVKCLQSHVNIFAWSYEDMPGIDPRIACHKLAIKKGAKPVR